METPDGKVAEGTLDEKGFARINRVKPGIARSPSRNSTRTHGRRRDVRGRVETEASPGSSRETRRGRRVRGAGGECLNVIADRFGFFPKTLWDHPKNARLKSERKDPNILLPGDRVFIPEKTPREESAATEQRQRFRRKGVPSKMKIRLQRCGTAEPYANKRYVLNLDGKLSEGTVDGEGERGAPDPPQVRGKPS